MREEITAVDISGLPDLVRLVEEVERSRQPRLLKCGDREVALLSPVATQRASDKSARRRLSRDEADDPFGGIVGIGDAAGSPDDPTDVADNKHRYLADAYAPPHS
jgi:hypothetical protein